MFDLAENPGALVGEPLRHLMPRMRSAAFSVCLDPFDVLQS